MSLSLGCCVLALASSPQHNLLLIQSKARPVPPSTIVTEEIKKETNISREAKPRGPHHQPHITTEVSNHHLQLSNTTSTWYRKHSLHRWSESTVVNTYQPLVSESSGQSTDSKTPLVCQYSELTVKWWSTQPSCREYNYKLHSASNPNFTLPTIQE